MDNQNSENKIVNVDATPVDKGQLQKVEDVEKDYSYTRGQLYSLIEKGQEAINGIMELA